MQDRFQIAMDMGGFSLRGRPVVDENVDQSRPMLPGQNGSRELSGIQSSTASSAPISWNFYRNGLSARGPGSFACRAGSSSLYIEHPLSTYRIGLRSELTASIRKLGRGRRPWNNSPGQFVDCPNGQDPASNRSLIKFPLPSRYIIIFPYG